MVRVYCNTVHTAHQTTYVGLELKMRSIRSCNRYYTVLLKVELLLVTQCFLSFLFYQCSGVENALVMFLEDLYFTELLPKLNSCIFMQVINKNLLFTFYICISSS